MTSKKLWKVILLNIFTLPGAGQWHLKHRKRAALFFTPIGIWFVAFLWQLMTIIATRYQGLIKQSRFDILGASKRISEGMWQTHGTTLKMYVFVLLVIYILSIADCVWLYLNSGDEK